MGCGVSATEARSSQNVSNASDHDSVVEIDKAAAIYVKRKANESPVVILSTMKKSESTGSIEEILLKYKVPSDMQIRFDLNKELGVSKENTSTKELLKEIEKLLTVSPKLFIGADPIGGIGDVAKMDASGELKTRLQLLGLTGNSTENGARLVPLPNTVQDV